MRLTATDKKILFAIADKVNRDFSRNYSIAGLAATAHMSASRFKAGFASIFGNRYSNISCIKKWPLRTTGSLKMH